MPLLLILKVVCLLGVAVAEIYIVEAGARGRRGPTLNDGFSFCPLDFSSKGFTIVCDMSGASSVTFFVNGKYQRRDNAPPYAINGDDAHMKVLFPYKDYPHEALIECRGNNVMRTETVSGYFRCTSDDDNYPSVPTESKTLAGRTNQGICIEITSTEYSNKPNIGWLQVTDGMAYRLFDASTSIAHAGEAPLIYDFVAMSSAYFGITLELTTAASTQFNSVWLKFEEGITARRGSHTLDQGSDWIQATSNLVGYGMIATALGNDAYSMSTTKPLIQGKKYTISVAGRSSRVVVHSILLIECSGEDCQASSDHWKKVLHTC